MGALRGVFFLFLLTCTLFNTTWALVVKGISIENTSKTPMVMVQLSEPYDLKLERPDDETVLIDFPPDTEWEVAPSNTTGNPSGIRGYKFVPYQDGSGELMIKINPRLLIDQSGTAPNGIFGISFSNMDKLDTNVLKVKKFHIGQKEGMTRIVLELNRSGNFSVTENHDGTKIFVTPLEKTDWLIAKNVHRSATPSSDVLYKGYNLTEKENQTGMEIMVVPGARILKTALIDTKTTSPKLVIDFGVNPFTPDKVLLQQKKCPLKVDADEGFDLKPKKKVPIPFETAIFPNKELIQRFDIISQRDDTIIRLVSRKRVDVKVTENSHTNQIILHLPKINWTEVKVPEDKGGLIKNFQLNQEDPRFTDLILNVEKGTHIIGKNTFSGQGEYRFIMYLNENEEKTPDWLIEASVAKLSYAARDREHAEVSRVVYQGGISPYMNIGDGFYMGIQGDVVSGENSSHTKSGTNSTQVSGGHFGGGAHVFAGYGVAMNRLYTGGELGVGLYGVDEKESYTNNINTTNSNSQVRRSWNVTGRVGIYASPTSLLYGRLGIASTAFSYNASPSATDNPIFPGQYKRNNQTGFILGLGMESALNDTLTVRLGASQTTYQTTHYLNGPNFKKDRMILNQLDLGLGYKFSPMSGPAAGDFFEESVGTGLYFGGALGASSILNTRSVQGLSGGHTTRYKGQSLDAEPVWGAFAGYSTNMGRFYMASEAEVSRTQAHYTESLYTNGTMTQSYTDKLNWIWAITARPGYIFNHGTIAYGRFGVMGGDFSHSGQINGANRTFTTGSKVKQNVIGVRMGGGLETFLSKQVSLRADYVVDYMSRIQLKDKQVPSAVEKVTLLNNEFKLGVAYTLDP